MLTLAPVAGASSGGQIGFMLTKVRLQDGQPLAKVLPGGAHPAIVGGSQIPITQAPWQVVVIGVLPNTERIYCGGSILNANEVLTAAHCVFNPTTKTEFPAGQILIGAGTADFKGIEPEEQASLASSVRVHPYFIPEAPQPIPDDVAVLKLATPLKFTPAVKPIALAQAGSLFQEGTPVHLTGFGQQNPGGGLDGKLYSIGLILGESHECGREADAVFLCASTPEGSVCFGDSGGGLTVPGAPAFLAGVTNTVQVFKGECFEGAVASFANVAAPEIRDFIVENSPKPPRAPRGEGASLEGVPMVGDKLTCERGVWTHEPSFTYAFIDDASGQVLQRSGSSTYLLSPADVGRVIICEVQAANAGGTGIDQSEDGAPVKPTPQEEAVAKQKLEAEAAAARSHQEEVAAAAARRQQEEQAASGVAGSEENAPLLIPDAKLATTALEASSSGVVSIKVSCPAGESSCSGTVTLRTLGAVSTSAGGSAKKKATVLTLASGSFTVAGGRVKTVTLHLSEKARSLLARSHVLRARATVFAHDPAGATHTTQTTVTLHAHKGRHGKG
jgi:Trypsin